MLVMMANDGEHEPKRMKRLADVLAGDGMELHDLPFGRSKIAALFKNFIGNGDLAEIVEVTATFQGDQGVLVHAEVPAQFNGVNGETFAMALGVRIATLDDQTQSAEDGVGSFKFVGEFFEAKERLHASDKLFSEDGLIQEIVGAGFDTAHFVAAIAESGDQ